MGLRTDVWYCNDYPNTPVVWVVSIQDITNYALCTGPRYFEFVAKPTAKQIRKAVKTFKELEAAWIKEQAEYCAEYLKELADEASN